MKPDKINNTAELKNIGEGLSENCLDAAGLHGVMSVMECVFSGDTPSDETIAEAFFGLCRHVKRLEEGLTTACIELSRVQTELEKKEGKEDGQQTA